MIDFGSMGKVQSKPVFLPGTGQTIGNVMMELYGPHPQLAVIDGKAYSIRRFTFANGREVDMDTFRFETEQEMRDFAIRNAIDG